MRLLTKIRCKRDGENESERVFVCVCVCVCVCVRERERERERLTYCIRLDSFIHNKLQFMNFKMQIFFKISKLVKT